MKLKFVVLFSLLVVSGCSSEYSPEELEVSSTGVFVERGTDSLIDGTFMIKKAAGESLKIEFEGGLPYGVVEMRNEKDDVTHRSNFTHRKKQKSVDSDIGLINRMLRDTGKLSTKDYLHLFESFADYDGEYLEVDESNRKIEGMFREGEKIGRWQEYCSNQQLESDKTYKEFNEAGIRVIKKVAKEQQFTCSGDVLLSANRDKDGHLQGEYLENYSNNPEGLFGNRSESKIKPKQKYVYHYKDGEFDGIQKEFNADGLIMKEASYKEGVLDGIQKTYDQDGKIVLENSYQNSLKHGEEKVYLSNHDSLTEETTHWLSEVKNYAEGQLNGTYQKLDSRGRNLQSGVYKDDKEVGLWETSNYFKNTKIVTDYDASNFTLERARPFKDACFLPSHYLTIVDWSSKGVTSLEDCAYYIERGLVDINKKIALDQKDAFEKSNHWTYPAIVASPAVYDYMKSHGLKTQFTDSVGRTRLHYCLLQFRSQLSENLKCDMDQIITYMDDVDLNSVSNVGTLFHQLAQPYISISNKELKALVINEKRITEALIKKGADINQINHQGKTALMAAIKNENYYIAEHLIDSGASVKGVDSNGKNVLGHFFLSSENKLNRSELSADATRVLAKVIALGVDPNAPILSNKSVQVLSEENNKLIHIQALNSAITMSSTFRDEFKDRPEIEVTKVAVVAQNEFIEAKKSLLSDSTGSENTVDQVKLLEQPKEEVRSNIEQLLSKEAKHENNVQLNKVLAGSSEATELLEQQADFLVKQANEHIAKYRLKTPKNNNALDSLEQLKKIDFENENISIIEKSIGEKYLGLAAKKMQEGQKSAAQRYLNSASEFIKDEAVLVDYQARVEATKQYVEPPLIATRVRSRPLYRTQSPPAPVAPIACDPVVSFSGIPLIGGQSFTAQQSLPISSRSALDKSARAVRLIYNRVVASGNQITYEQATSINPIKFTLTVVPSGSYSQIRIKAKTPTGIVLKKSGYKKGFCDLLAKF